MTHPDPAFGWHDEAAMRAFVDGGFATIAVAAGDRAPLLVHAPVVAHADGTLRFHVARANRAFERLDGAAATLCVLAADHYVSPDWYALPDQVPTWNYAAVEVDGRLAMLDEPALVASLDDLTAAGEARLAPKPAWTRAKLAPERFAAMLRAIRGFALTPAAWRGTVKRSQNKPAAVRARVAEALRARGLDDVAARTLSGIA